MLICPQILANPTTEATAHREGIAYVTVRMDWYCELSRLLLEENKVDGGSSKALRSKLEDHVVDLYKALLIYLIKSVCSYYRNRILGFVRDTIKLDGWDDNLKAVREAEKAVQQDSAEYNTQQIRSHLEQLVDIAKNQETKLLQNIHQDLQDQASLQRQKRDEQCLWDLRLTDPNDDMKRIEESKDHLLEGSYVWVLKHSHFIDWRDGDDARLLWIKGGPGKGKTMLLIGIVKELKSTCHSGLVLYFFCQATDPNLRTATAVLRGLIYQLLVQQPSLISHIRKKYDKAGPKLFEGNNVFYALSEIFQNMLNDPELRAAYLIVDALDECETELSQLLGLLTQTASAPSARVKWIVSSRNRPDIEQRLTLDDSRLRLDLELDTEHVSHAIDVYIDHKVTQLTSIKHDKALQDHVRNQMRQKAESTFLWAALVFKELQDVQSWDVLQVLEEVPDGLNPLYDRMVKQIRQLKRRYPEFCRVVLLTVTLAYRPLHLLELRVLAGLQEIPDMADLERIINMCGSFLMIRGDHVYLIHQSAKDYLTTHAGSEIFPSGHAEGHRMIISRSLQAMSTILRRDIYDLRDPGRSIDEVESVYPDPLASIRYTCVYWIEHLCEIERTLYDQVGLCDNGTIHLFLKKHFLHWLEALSLMGSMSSGVISMRKMEDLLAVSIGFLTLTGVSLS